MSKRSMETTGTCIYSDVIPRAGKRFLDRSQLLPAMGLLPTLGKLSSPVPPVNMGTWTRES